MLKFILIAIYVSLTHSAKLPTRTAFGQVQVPVQQSQVPTVEDVKRPVNNIMIDRPIGIVQQESNMNPDGSYHSVWETENGIKVEEEGIIKAITKDAVTQTVLEKYGKVVYTDDDGTPFVLTYTADENGFHPQGDHLPTPPPVPHDIARALQYIADHPYVESDIVDGNDSPIIEDN